MVISMRTKFVPLIAFSLVALLAVAGTAAAQSEDPTPEAPRWLETEHEVSLDEDLRELSLDGTTDLHEFQTDNRALEFECGGSVCTADDLRETYQQNPDARDDLVEAIESAVEERIDAALANLARGDASPSSNATVDESALAEPVEGSPYQPAIPIAAEGSVALGLLDGTDVDADQAEALFRMGAQVDQAIDQEVRPGTNLTLTLSAPSPASVISANAGTTAGDGSQVTWTETNWRSSEPVAIEDEVRLGDPSVEVPNATDAEVGVRLDIADVNVRYGDVFGDAAPADATVAVTVDGRFAAIENPREIDRVHLPYLSADAIRIALENDLLETRQLLSLEEQARRQMKQTMEEITGESVQVSGGFPAGDLSSQAVGEPAGTGEPITLRLNTSAQVPFPPEQPAGAQGFTVTTLSMGSFDLPNIDTPYGSDSAITVVLPEGLDLDFEPPAGYDVEETTQDGRQAYVFASNGEDGSGEAATVQNADVVVNHPFVWDVFWPVLVALALLLIVLPAVVIGLTIRRRRRRGPPSAGESAQPIAGSQASQRSSPDEE